MHRKVLIMLVKGTKLRYLREAFNKLAPNNNYDSLSYGIVNNWLKKNYKTTVAETTYYRMRRNLIDNKQVVEAKPVNDLVSLITTLKTVLSKIGKEQTKNLIDLIN